jgi:hypothetical protein
MIEQCCICCLLMLCLAVAAAARCCCSSLVLPQLMSAALRLFNQNMAHSLLLLLLLQHCDAGMVKNTIIRSVELQVLGHPVESAEVRAFWVPNKQFILLLHQSSKHHNVCAAILCSLLICWHMAGTPSPEQ